MQIEINEEMIAEEVKRQLETSVKGMVKSMISNWSFEQKLNSVVKKAIDEHVQDVVNSVVADVDSVRNIAHKQLVNSIKSRLRRALDMQEKLENEREIGKREGK